MNKIYLITFNQYGYHTDMLKYAEYLSKKYEVVYICKHQDLPKVDSASDNISIVYVPQSYSKIDFIKEIIKVVGQCKNNKIIVDYFAGCSVLPISLKSDKTILDIRTGTINDSKVKKFIRDRLIKIESYFYDTIITLSEGLRKELKLNQRKTTIVPLGADRQIDLSKIESQSLIDILYVGTYDNRNLIDMITGFHKFCNKREDKRESVHLNMVGYSNTGEDIKMQEYIERNNLYNVTMHGRLTHDKLHEMWASNLIGISYIPMTRYFMNQPPTKTFEYLANGLICIATNTKYNREIINEFNGICIEDNAESFSNALESIVDNIESYNRLNISKDAEKYSWENIVNNILIRCIEE
ncbi:MAG: glycosyltransferase [Clostridium sp.]